MSFLSNLFSRSAKYNDEQLVSQARTAIETDPMIDDPSTLVVTSEQGVMTLAGVVHRRQEKDRIEGVIRSALTARGLKHERIINDLKLPNQAG